MIQDLFVVVTLFYLFIAALVLLSVLTLLDNFN